MGGRVLVLVATLHRVHVGGLLHVTEELPNRAGVVGGLALYLDVALSWRIDTKHSEFSTSSRWVPQRQMIHSSRDKLELDYLYSPSPKLAPLAIELSIILKRSHTPMARPES